MSKTIQLGEFGSVSISKVGTFELIDLLAMLEEDGKIGTLIDLAQTQPEKIIFKIPKLARSILSGLPNAIKFNYSTPMHDFPIEYAIEIYNAFMEVNGNVLQEMMSKLVPAESS
jgi:hypothetical protein